VGGNHVSMTHFKRTAPVWVTMVVLTTLALLVGHRHQYQIDASSGRTRESPALWNFGYWWTERDTVLSETLSRAGVVFDPPRWHFTHTAGGSARINHRYGGLETSINHLTSWFDLVDVPPPDRTRLCFAAFDCLKNRRGFIVTVEAEPFSLAMVGDDRAVIECWQAPGDTAK
jgi:hypothetical protein